MTDSRAEYLGKIVRQAWLDFCLETKQPESHGHSAPWEELTDWEKEVDRRIGVAVSVGAIPQAVDMLLRDRTDGLTLPEILQQLDLVFEWHKVPGDGSFQMWLCQEVERLRTERAELLGRVREAREHLLSFDFSPYEFLKELDTTLSGEQHGN